MLMHVRGPGVPGMHTHPSGTGALRMAKSNRFNRRCVAVLSHSLSLSFCSDIRAVITKVPQPPHSLTHISINADVNPASTTHAHTPDRKTGAQYNSLMNLRCHRFQELSVAKYFLDPTIKRTSPTRTHTLSHTLPHI